MGAEARALFHMCPIRFLWGLCGRVDKHCVTTACACGINFWESKHCCKGNLYGFWFIATSHQRSTPSSFALCKYLYSWAPVVLCQGGICCSFMPFTAAWRDPLEIGGPMSSLVCGPSKLQAPCRLESSLGGWHSQGCYGYLHCGLSFCTLRPTYLSSTNCQTPCPWL